MVSTRSRTGKQPFQTSSLSVWDCPPLTELSLPPAASQSTPPSASSGGSNSNSTAISRKRALPAKTQPEGREPARSKKPRTSTAAATASCSEGAETPQSFEFGSRDGTVADTPATTVVTDAEDGGDTRASSAKGKGKGKAKGKGRATEIPASEDEEESDDVLSDYDGDGDGGDDDVAEDGSDEEFVDRPHRSVPRTARRRPQKAAAQHPRSDSDPDPDSDSDPSWESDGDGDGEPDPEAEDTDQEDHSRPARTVAETRAETRVFKCSPCCGRSPG